VGLSFYDASVGVVRIRDDARSGDVHIEPLVLLDMPERVSVRDLIRTRVREEVARANADRSQSLSLLVSPVDAEKTLNGYRRRAERLIDWERQAEVALEAFEKQKFFVFVDGTQVEALDEEIALGADTEVRFLRLTPLVGG
jgi:hypothetical protein